MGSVKDFKTLILVVLKEESDDDLMHVDFVSECEVATLVHQGESS